MHNMIAAIEKGRWLSLPNTFVWCAFSRKRKATISRWLICWHSFSVSPSLLFLLRNEAHYYVSTPLPPNKANKTLKENCQLVIQSVMQRWGPDKGIANHENPVITYNTTESKVVKNLTMKEQRTTIIIRKKFNKCCHFKLSMVIIMKLMECCSKTNICAINKYLINLA